ncbi:COX15/CtaA family protein [Spirosoma montaniterrae]|uniref:Cytochrome oxidase assembly protein n=1 Tax=Spirosoma montaniterrae TaxID=1178516 RepID=A0A1P9X396_9BACT|nr:COX15/CtaA family protein [Spirosoma montaniterrae]AQG82083.1 cytochrome oxidase assembly protein [Spirosoma montaniterrae]
MTSSSNLINHTERRFQSLLSLTIVVIFLLILAGGIVRGTGSGMGCPDWPKCFGQWIPPTEVSQLPPNYQQIYGAKLKGEVEFNAVKTWIEYVNRLLGVLSGLLVFATVVSSFSFLRKDKAIFWGSVAALLLIGANGWLGSRVVATELAHYMITLHLLLAILVVFSLLFVYVRVSSPQRDILTPKKILVSRSFNKLLLVTMLLSFGQILLGTQVREALDEVVGRLGYEQRANWVDSLDWRFYVHRSFSLIILAFHIAVIVRLRKALHSVWLTQIANALIWLVVAEIATGAIMGYFGVPAFAQPIHLLLAVVMIGFQFMAWLIVNPSLSLSKEASRKAHLLEI